MNDYIGKPFLLEELTAVLARHVPAPAPAAPERDALPAR